MELLFISFVIFEICLMLYIIYKISFYSLYVVFTIVFFLSYIYPYTYKLYNLNIHFYDSMTNYGYFDKALIISVVFKIIFDVCYILFYKKNKRNIYQRNIVKFNKNRIITIIKYKYLFIILIINTVAFFFFLGFDNLINPSGRFVGNNPLMLNFTRAIYYLLLLVFSIKSFSSNKNKSLLLLTFILTLIYPMLISSRSVVFPFIIVASTAIVFKKYKTAFVLMILASLFLVTALFDRGDVGVINFIFKLKDGILMLFQLIPILVDTMNSFMMLTLSLGGLSSGTIDVHPNPLLFILYLSPIPSFFLPENTYLYQSLTPYYNFSIGINNVLIPELIFWLGSYGPYLFAPLLAGLMYKTDNKIFLQKSGNINILYSFYYFAIIVFIIMSTVASLRASSRLFMYIFAIYFIIKLIRRFKI